jgi:exonuclease I
MGDWLGTERVADHLRAYRDYTSAREFARKLGLKTRTDWNSYCKGLHTELPSLPQDISKNPNQTYLHKGWNGWAEWLGTDFVHHTKKSLLSFEEARKFVRTLRLSSREDWQAYCKGKVPGKPPKPDNVPANPSNSYKDKGWNGWGEWLGTGFTHHSKISLLPFEEARRFVRTLRLSTQEEWQAYCKGKIVGKPPKPDNVPANPRRVYSKSGWVDLSDWLGTG